MPQLRLPLWDQAGNVGQGFWGGSVPRKVADVDCRCCAGSPADFKLRDSTSAVTVSLSNVLRAGRRSELAQAPVSFAHYGLGSTEKYCLLLLRL
jgi:hypothetical protein